MVRLSDLSAARQQSVTTVECPTFDSQPWVVPAAAAARRVALISSAGLHPRDAAPFQGGDGGYRELPDAAADGDFLMSHVSVNYDRTGFQQDLETVLPRRRLRELAEAGHIGAVADTHYAFMGASAPAAMQAEARALAARLLADGVNTAVLLPV